MQLEIGHRATPKTKQTPEGHTHDWYVQLCYQFNIKPSYFHCYYFFHFRTVFVRGPENSNIQHFVEKVVFHLHDSFHKPKRG